MPSGAKTNIVAEYNYDHAGRNNRNFFKVGGGGKTKDQPHLLQRRREHKHQISGRSTNHSSPRNYLQKIDYDYLDNGYARRDQHERPHRRGTGRRHSPARGPNRHGTRAPRPPAPAIPAKRTYSPSNSTATTFPP